MAMCTISIQATHKSELFVTYMDLQVQLQCSMAYFPFSAEVAGKRKWGVVMEM